LKIFEVEFMIPEKRELPEGMEVPEGLDVENLHEHVFRTLHFGGEDFFDVQEEAVSLIEDIFFEDYDEENDYYEIVGIRQLPNIEIVNWPENISPLIKAEHMADEDVMLIQCPNCDNVIRITEEGWDWVRCKECDTNILREQLIKLGKYHKVVKIGEDKSTK